MELDIEFFGEPCQGFHPDGPAIMIPLGETRKTAAIVTPSGAFSEAIFSVTPGKGQITASPLAAQAPSTEVSIKGDNISNAILVAKDKNKPNIALTILQADVKPKLPVHGDPLQTILMHVVRIDGDDPIALNSAPSASAFKTYLDGKIFGQQANRFFEVEKDVAVTTINYDVELADRKLQLPSSTESGLIDSGRDTSKFIHLYFVSEITDSNPPNNTVGLAEINKRVAWIETKALSLAAIEQTAAHEIGHLLGVLGHSSREDDLMGTKASAPSASDPQCRLRQKDWNTFNRVP